MPHRPTHSSSSGRAQELLIELLGRTSTDPAKDLAKLCAANPHEAEELTRLHAVHERLQADLAVFGDARREPSQPAYSEGARVGDTIGDFRLDARIASGGQGEVWEATQVSLKRRVALKLVLPDRINEKTLALFAREARAGGRLSHPGIVAVHGHGESDGRHWIAQELVEGAWTLRDFIDEMRSADELPGNYYRAVAVFMAELADALQAAHQAGVIHRDVKPQNILVTPDDHPKLTDFGLARITDESVMSMTGDFAGTWLYMSPEQVTAKRIELDHRTDIFSLGVVMYEMLALVRPFDGDTTHQIAENIVYRDPPDLRKLKSRVPRDLSVICGKALEKMKEARFPSMAEFAADLRRHLANLPIQAQPPTTLERGVKWVRRNPVKSAATALVTVALVVISGLSVQLSTKTTEAQANAAAEKKRADEVLRLSLSQNYDDLVAQAADIWPARPEKIGALVNWISKAGELLGELPALEAKREELRASALPRTDEERRLERESHPDFDKLALLRAEIDSKRQALAVRRGEQELELPEVDWDAYPSAASDLNRLAWPMLDPERTLFGQEALGLVLAQRAVELATADDVAGILDSVAWGSLGVGDDKGALDASRAALDAAPEGQAESFEANLAQVEAAVVAASGPTGLAAQDASLSELEANLTALDARVSERRAWTFPESEESQTRARWWHNTLNGLISRIKSLTTEGTGLATLDGVSEEHGWSVGRRLEFARRLQAGFSSGGEFLVRWEAAAAALAAAYPGLDLPVQMGLVPLGPDPDSKLWEFWHVQSGPEPLRNAAGVLELEESSGLVLVLLPGGKFWMGASKDPAAPHNYDPGAQSFESPVHEVELSAFFLSKYEMTQGQWKNLSGTNPSLYGPTSNFLDYQHDLTHPVEQVSWFASQALLDRVGLSLPSEAQWEYGARGGTQSVWWTGSDRETLRAKGAVNLADQAAGRADASWPSIKDWPELDDGYVVHAPVDSHAANAYGLYNVHGNVWEWCSDVFEDDFYARSSGENPANLSTASVRRTNRGGSFSSAASDARSALRNYRSPGAEYNLLGLRPAHAVQRY